MDFVHALLLIAGGILAASALIVAKKPEAKELIGKLVPFQALIGVALLAFGIYRGIHIVDFIRISSVAPLVGLTGVAIIVCSVLLGFMFGMPQIAKWMPGDGAAEQKGLELSRKLAPFQLIIGLVGLVAGLISLLYSLHILSPM